MFNHYCHGGEDWLSFLPSTFKKRALNLIHQPLLPDTNLNTFRKKN